MTSDAAFVMKDKLIEGFSFWPENNVTRVEKEGRRESKGRMTFFPVEREPESYSKCVVLCGRAAVSALPVECQ